MANKFYAVKVGITPGVYTSWDQCKANVNGFPGAIYKSFKTLAEAEAFAGVNETATNSPDNSIKASQDEIICYVDGSYRDDTKEFSYGTVIFHGENEIHKSGKSNEASLVEMRNVAGEITAAQVAMEYALSQACTKLTIYHDYEGVAKWCTGEWKANKTGTQAYRDFYNSIKEKIKVEFIKVKGHSNDKYNDLADSLAKEALGIDVF